MTYTLSEEEYKELLNNGNSMYDLYEATHEYNKEIIKNLQQKDFVKKIKEDKIISIKFKDSSISYYVKKNNNLTEIEKTILFLLENINRVKEVKIDFIELD